jgi:glucokinase
MSNQAKAIGIDFGGTSIKSAVVRGGAILQRGEVIDTVRHNTAQGVIAELLRVIGSMRTAHPETEAVGIGLPGFVDSVNGIVHELTNVHGWHEVALVALLREKTGLRAAIENDANAMAYGEFLHGAAKGARNAICITLGTGVGGGLILEGRLYRGSRLAAGEIGHTSIDSNGPRGVYGTPGDLETYVGNRQIAERAGRLYSASGQPRPLEKCTPADLAALAAAGDHIAIALWDAIGTDIGAALADGVWLLNPDTIVIGGGIAAAGDIIIAPIRRTICERTSALFHEELRVLPAALGNDAGIIGCAELALETA